MIVEQEHNYCFTHTFKSDPRSGTKFIFSDNELQHEATIKKSLLVEKLTESNPKAVFEALHA